MLLPARQRLALCAALLIVSCATVIRTQKSTTYTQTEPRVPRFTVKGRVVYDDTDRLVRRSAISLIQLFDRSGELAFATDPDGRFVIENVCAAQIASAQHGGKAEPNRIEFKRGATRTIVNGVVHGDEEAEYILSAKKGQRLIIKLTSAPAKSSVFQLLGADNDTLGLEYDANFNVSLVLPKTGDYFINVKRPTEAKGTSRYRLTVTVK